MTHPADECRSLRSAARAASTRRQAEMLAADVFVSVGHLPATDPHGAAGLPDGLGDALRSRIARSTGLPDSRHARRSWRQPPSSSGDIECPGVLCECPRFRTLASATCASRRSIVPRLITERRPRWTPVAPEVWPRLWRSATVLQGLPDIHLNGEPRESPFTSGARDSDTVRPFHPLFHSCRAPTSKPWGTVRPKWSLARRERAADGVTCRWKIPRGRRTIRRGRRTTGTGRRTARSGRRPSRRGRRATRTTLRSIPTGSRPVVIARRTIRTGSRRVVIARRIIRTR